MESPSFPRKEHDVGLSVPIDLVRVKSHEFKQDANKFDPTRPSSPNAFMDKLNMRYKSMHLIQ
jgi:hypothetical protein